MGYKNILLGVVSSSLFALLSHKLTKRYERNNACKLFDEQEDRFLMLKESLDNEIKFKTDTNKELRRRTTFLSKKIYHIDQIDIVDEIDYIESSNLSKEKKYDAIIHFRSLIEKLCKTECDDELNATLHDIKTFKQDINNIIGNKEKEERDKNAYEIFQKYESNISGQLNLPEEYKNNIFQIIETKIRLLETITEIKLFSYLKDDIKEINEIRKEPPYLVLSNNNLTIRHQIQIDRMLNKLLNPVFYKMKDIIFEYEFNLSNKNKNELNDLIYKTYEILDTNRYLEAENCFLLLIKTYKYICDIIVNNFLVSENADYGHKEICKIFNHCKHIMTYLIENDNDSLENYLNTHIEEKDMIDKIYKNVK